jgi:DNA-binding transcriptional MerR regulator
MPTDQEYTISELADIGGVTPRTVRYYISIGLLPAPGQVGPRTTYGSAILQRLRLIRRLQEDHLPLGEIGTRLGSMDDAAVDAALAVDEALPDDSALDYIRRLRASQTPAIQAVAPAPALALRVTEPSPASPFEPAPHPSKPALEPGTTQRSQWERVALSDNVELNIRRPLGRLDNKRIERLIRIAREILEEDQP